MVRGVAGVFRQTEEVVAILGVGREGLSNAGRASLHLTGPAGVGGRHAVYFRVAGPELVIELLPHREVAGVNGVDGNRLGRQARPLVTDIGNVEIGVIAELVLDGEIPLLGIWPTVGVKGTVIGPALAIQISWIDERGTGEILGKTVLKQEGRGQPVVRAAEGGSGVETILGHTTAPTWVEHLSKEDAVAGSHHGLGRHRIRNSQPGGKALFPNQFGSAAAEARRPPLVSGED